MTSSATSYSKKYMDNEALARHLAPLQAMGKKIVLCHGCFDMIHPGHLRYFDFAKKLGDVLVVSLSMDQHVNKGIERPLIPQELRVESLCALSMVDYVTLSPAETALPVIQTLKPDFYVKGKEYAQSRDPRFINERRGVESNGGKVIFSSGEVVFSSTHLINQMPPMADLQQEKYRAIMDRHGINSDWIESTVQRFANLKVLIVGDVIQDRYIFCSAKGLANEAPVATLVPLEERSYLGGAGIVAAHCAALGADVTLVSPAGGNLLDLASDKEALRPFANRIHMWNKPERPESFMPVKTRYLIGSQKVMKLESGGQCSFPIEWEDQLITELKKAAPGFDACFIIDFGYGFITHRLAQELSAEMARLGKPVLGDASGVGVDRFLSYTNATVITPNEAEARILAQDQTGGISSVAHKIFQRTPIKNLIITMGEKGSLIFYGDGFRQDTERLTQDYFPPIECRALDQVGAGDAFLAGMGLSLGAKATLPQAAFVGTCMATLEVQKMGNLPVTLDELCRSL